MHCLNCGEIYDAMTGRHIHNNSNLCGDVIGKKPETNIS
jgi:hypothetical protein